MNSFYIDGIRDSIGHMTFRDAEYVVRQLAKNAKITVSEALKLLKDRGATDSETEFLRIEAGLR